MQLVIAEKPSVARDLARVLGVPASGRHKLEGAGRVITWCIGHLVELEEPAAYDPRWKSWRMDTLPMIPAAFKLRPVAGTRDQLRVVGDLLRDRRFSEVVNGCDAGREGELIFRYVYELARSRLPVRRLWISSLTDEAIRQGFASLRPGSAYDALADAARCRSEADWLVGMNATRAMTLRLRAGAAAMPDGATRPADPDRSTAASSRISASGAAGPAADRAWGDRGRRSARRGSATAGGRRDGAGPGGPPAVFSIGRVQTPTLAILVRREQAIQSFRPRDYWEVRGAFAGAARAGDAAGAQATPDASAWFNALWTERRGPGQGAVSRLASRELADQVTTRAAGAASGAGVDGPCVESLTQKRTREPPPQLFDLTSLQRTANRRYGFSATRTLEAAQALYERHKVLTYPRTDSRYLPTDLAATLPDLFAGLARIPVYASFAVPLQQAPPPSPPALRRVFDASKVHDHHAIIPTGKVPAPAALGADEQRIFDLVARRFLGVFHPDAEFASTEAVIRVGAPPPTPSTGRDKVEAPREQDRGSGRTGGGESSDEPVLAALPPPPDRFVARGRVRLVAGWQVVAGIDDRPAPVAGGRGGPADDAAADRAEATLPPLEQGQRLQARFEVVARQTRPPPRHTEATLLGAMESAGREMEDEILRAAMKDTGLGTPATRASTIETLVKRGFIAREGKQVIATPAGIALIERLPVPTLASPELTGSWEARLVRIARGQEGRHAFMTDIGDYVRQVLVAVRGAGTAAARPPLEADSSVVAAAVGRGRGALAPPVDPSCVLAASEPRQPPAEPIPALVCPRCHQGSLLPGHRGWGCSRWRLGCPFVIWFQVAGKRITPSQLRDLVQKGKTRISTWSVPAADRSPHLEDPTTTRASAAPRPTAQAGATRGCLVLDLTASRERGAARFHPA